MSQFSSFTLQPWIVVLGLFVIVVLVAIGYAFMRNLTTIDPTAMDTKIAPTRIKTEESEIDLDYFEKCTRLTSNTP